MKVPKTLCINCRHAFTTSTQRLFSKSPWYHQFCRAYRAQQAVDPVTGRVMWVDDKGCPVCNEYAHCRDRNRGDCERFEKCGPTS